MRVASSIVPCGGREAMLHPGSIGASPKEPQYPPPRKRVSRNGFRPPMQAVTSRFQSEEPPGSAYGVPEDLGEHDLLSMEGSSCTLAGMIVLPDSAVSRKRKEPSQWKPLHNGWTEWSGRTG